MFIYAQNNHNCDWLIKFQITIKLNIIVKYYNLIKINMGTLSSSETFEEKFMESFRKKYEFINEVIITLII